MYTHTLNIFRTLLYLIKYKACICKMYTGNMSLKGCCERDKRRERVEMSRQQHKQMLVWIKHKILYIIMIYSTVFKISYYNNHIILAIFCVPYIHQSLFTVASHLDTGAKNSNTVLYCFITNVRVYSNTKKKKNKNYNQMQ